MASRGIGDVVWHVPLLRGLAAATPEGSVVFLTRETTRAAEILACEPAVGRTVYIPYHGKGARGRELADLKRALEALRPRALWIMDETWRPAAAAWLARVPERRGMGEAFAQRTFLSPGPRLHGPKGEKLDRLSALARLWDLPPADEPLLLADPGEAGRAAEAFAGRPRPWIGYGLTASHPYKVWPEERFRAVARALGGTAFFIGAAADADKLERAAVETGGEAVAGWPLERAMGLISQLDLFVGNDSGPLNVAAGLGVPAVGVFGPTPVISYSRHLHAVRSPDGSMEGATVASVVGRARALLAGAEAQASPASAFAAS
jgi:heptosyltransferase-2